MSETQNELENVKPQTIEVKETDVPQPIEGKKEKIPKLRSYPKYAKSTIGGYVTPKGQLLQGAELEKERKQAIAEADPVVGEASEPQPGKSNAQAKKSWYAQRVAREHYVEVSGEHLRSLISKIRVGGPYWATDPFSNSWYVTQQPSDQCQGRYVALVRGKIIFVARTDYAAYAFAQSVLGC